MKFLIDNQLPIALVSHLQTHGLEAIHVSDCGLERATDKDIWDPRKLNNSSGSLAKVQWDYAKAHNCVIVSKDEDFLHLSGMDPDGPAFVWVRLGNCRNAALFAAFDSVLANLVQTLDAGATVVEVR